MNTKTRHQHDHDHAHKRPEAEGCGSLATHRAQRQNIPAALGINGVFFLRALVRSATRWLTLFADTGASLVVVANRLRLLRGLSGEALHKQAAMRRSEHQHAH